MKTVNKKWGLEFWIVNSVFPPYCGKKLVLFKGFRVSFHKHKKKDEAFYIGSGLVIMKTDGHIVRATMKEGNSFTTEELNGEQEWKIKPGDSVRIYPGTYHSFGGLEESEIFEFSSHHDDSDTYRKDESGKMCPDFYEKYREEVSELLRES